MALSVDTLKAELAKFLDPNDPAFAGLPTSLNFAAAKWANAYQAYASAAKDASGDAVATAFASKFEDAIKNLGQPQTPAQAAAIFGTAFTDYWAGATFSTGTLPASGVGGTGIFASEVTSAVTVVNAVGLIAALTTEFANNSATASTKIAALAAKLHAATTTGVTVLISGLDTTPLGSGGPLPITNTGAIS
jgi:hypothetical protein